MNKVSAVQRQFVYGRFRNDLPDRRCFRFDQRLRADHSPLRLSIDVRLQVALRDSVEKAIGDFNGIGGAGVVMDVNTAEVLGKVNFRF